MARRESISKKGFRPPPPMEMRMRRRMERRERGRREPTKKEEIRVVEYERFRTRFRMEEREMREERNAAYRRALSDGVVEVAYSRVLFLGTAGVGKSSFRKSLMKLPWDHHTNSTIISDVSRVRPFAKEWYAPKSEQWKEVTHEDEIEGMAHLFNALYKNETHCPVLLESPTDKATTATTPIYVTAASDKLDLILLEVCKFPLPPQSSTVDQQPHLLMHFWDCGGQPVFLEILPVFLTSRTIFLLHFDASKDLNSKWKSVHHIDGVRYDEEEVGVSTLSYMLSWMANVHGHLMKYGEDGSVPEYPRMFCIGTHKDELLKKKKDPEQVRSELVSHYRGKDYAKLISDTLIIDNTSSGKGELEDPNIGKMRSAIIDITKKKLIVQTPIGWVLFHKVLEALNKNIVSLSLAYDVGAVCKILPEDVPQVLLFYHELGAVLYYPQLSGLKDKVIVRPKFFVDALGKLFTSLMHYITNPGTTTYPGFTNEWDTLRKYGILIETLSAVVWNSKECGDLKAEDFIEVLLHFRLAAIICIEDEEICPSNLKHYFIPTILKLCCNDTAAVPHSKEMATPLHIIFGTHFVPPGFFTRFVAVIASYGYITIHTTEGVYRNRVTFRYEDPKNRSIEHLTVTDQHDVIQINVYRPTYCLDPVPLSTVCQDILVLLEESAKKVEEVLQNSVGRGFEELPKYFVSRSFRYVCDHCPPSVNPHYLKPAGFQFQHPTIICNKNQIYRPLTEKEKFWFTKEVRETVETRSDTTETRGDKETGDKTVKHEQFVGTTSAATSGSSNSDHWNALENNRGDLKDLLSISEPIFRDIASACREKRLIVSTEHAVIFDEMTGQTLMQRADKFIDYISSALKFCPDQLDVFLDILREKGNIAIIRVAEKIAQSKS